MTQSNTWGHSPYAENPPSEGKEQSMKRKMKRSTFLLGVGGAAALASFRLQSSEGALTGPETSSG